MSMLRLLTILLLTCSVAACTTLTRKPYNVTPDIQTSIGKDLFMDLDTTFFANKTSLKIKPENEAEVTLATMARTAGFAVSEDVGEDVQIHIYYLEASNSYVATMTVGEFRRFTKEFRSFPEGLQQVGLTSIGE